MSETVDSQPSLASSIPRGGIGIHEFYFAHFLAAVFPATAGIILYGWHAFVVVAGLLTFATVAVVLWRRMGIRGRLLQYSQGLWFALVLALMLPAHLAAEGFDGHASGWALIPMAALLLVMLLWLVGGPGGWHLHPVLVTYLLLALCFPNLLVPRRILNRDHLLIGELLRGSEPDEHPSLNEPWIGRMHNATDADYEIPARGRLGQYTSGRETPPRHWLSLSGLLRDWLPPLEDFIIAGQPAAIGTSSVVAVIIGGLFLMYRGMADVRVPLLTVLSAYSAMLVLPIPTVISSSPQWHWLAYRQPDIGWSVALTFVNYEIMASPLIFMAFFLASAPMVRPLTRRGRTIFALFLGITSAAFQLYVSVSYGPYLALLIVSLLTPELDRWFGVRPLF